LGHVLGVPGAHRLEPLEEVRVVDLAFLDVPDHAAVEHLPLAGVLDGIQLGSGFLSGAGGWHFYFFSLSLMCFLKGLAFGHAWVTSAPLSAGCSVLNPHLGQT